MNLFILDQDPDKAARYYCDSHCIKICLEAAQLLCTTFRLQGIEAPYKVTHINHPVSKWVRESSANFAWALEHAMCICMEYTRRYNKVHGCQKVIEWCQQNANKLTFPSSERTPFALAMPDDCKHDDPVVAYRNYYIIHKKHILSWKNGKPDWI